MLQVTHQLLRVREVSIRTWTGNGAQPGTGHIRAPPVKTTIHEQLIDENGEEGEFRRGRGGGRGPGNETI